MNLFEALFLGLLQGLGEFLPISSSGHLKLAEHFLDLPHAEELLPFDVLLHLGTLLAVVIYFRDDLRRVSAAWLRTLPQVLRRGGWRVLEVHPEAKRGWLVLITMVPTGLLALGLRNQADAIGANVHVVAFLLLVTGALNWFADRRTQRPGPGRRIEQMSARDAVWCGCAQGLSAVLRGLSRSGSTITTGLLLGLDREEAPRFSFLMAIPAVLAAALVEVPKLLDSETVPGACMVAGFVAAAITGYIAVDVVLKVAKQRRLRYFAYYCWSVGALALIALRLGY